MGKGGSCLEMPLAAVGASNSCPVLAAAADTLPATLAPLPPLCSHKAAAASEAMLPKLRARRVGRELASLESDLPVRCVGYLLRVWECWPGVDGWICCIFAYQDRRQGPYLLVGCADPV